MPEEVKPQEIVIKVVQDQQKPEKKVEEKTEEPKEKETEKKRFVDGSFRAWEWENSDVSQEPLWAVGADALGLSPEERNHFTNEIADVVKLSAEYLQDDSETVIFNFISKLLRHTPRAGSPIMNILRQLEIMNKEVKEGGKEV